MLASTFEAAWSISADASWNRRNMPRVSVVGPKMPMPRLTPVRGAGLEQTAHVSTLTEDERISSAVWPSLQR